MQLRSKKTLAVASATLAVVGGGGAALAASGGSTSPTSFLDDVAKHLGISSQKLQDATKAAAIDQVDAALNAGTITKQEADDLKARIQAGDFPPFFGPFFPRAFRFREHFFVFGDKLSAAADYLGLGVAELRKRLANGQSLADVAKAQGKPVDGLKQAMLDAVKKKLDAAVANGRLTKDQAKAILDRLQARIDDLVNRTFLRPGLRWFRGPGPRGFFAPRRDDPPPWRAVA